MEHFSDAFELGEADAVLAASLFHFGEVTIPELKDYLQKKTLQSENHKNTRESYSRFFIDRKEHFFLVNDIGEYILWQQPAEFCFAFSVESLVCSVFLGERKTFQEFHIHGFIFAIFVFKSNQMLLSLLFFYVL